MRNCKNLSLIIFCLLIITGCTNTLYSYRSIQENKENGSIVVDLETAIRNAESRTYEEMADSVKIITLETSSNSLLSFIYKIEATEKYIYIIDFFNGGRMLIFDFEGELKKEIPRGQAPHEIGLADDFFYNYQDSVLYIWDGMANKIVKFTPDGQYLSHHFLDYDFQTRGIAAIDSSIFLAQHSRFDFQIMKADTSWQNKALWKFGNDDYNCYVWYFQAYGNGLNINKLMDDNIYYYKDNEINVKYTLKYKKTQIDPTPYKRKLSDMEENLPPDAYLYIGNNKELQDYLYIEMRKSMAQDWFFINKKSNKSWKREYNQNSLFSYLTHGTVYKVQGNWMLGTIETDIFKDPVYGWDGSNPNNLISPEDMEKLRNVTPDDNPIIVLFKLKDDI